MKNIDIPQLKNIKPKNKLRTKQSNKKMKFNTNMKQKKPDIKLNIKPKKINKKQIKSIYVISHIRKEKYKSKLKNKKSNIITNKHRITKKIKQNKKQTTK